MDKGGKPNRRAPVRTQAQYRLVLQACPSLREPARWIIIRGALLGGHVCPDQRRLLMATQARPEGKARSFGENLESDLALEFLRIVEVAAIASARTMGQGERKLSDQVATEAMRQTMQTIPMRGTIVIGEGERAEEPMLYIGEKVGAEFPDGTEVPEVDIAVDPLEGTNLCATGAPGSITVLAASERGGLLNAPDCYMEKIVVGPSCKNAVELDAPVADNLKNIARRLDRDVQDLVVIVLDRPRHEKLIGDIRACGARIRLIGDGDLSAGIAERQQ